MQITDTLADRVIISPAQLAAFCQKHHIRKLALFGSVLRDDFSGDSDVDVLVEFELGTVVGFFELMDAQMELAQLIGREVDMNTVGFLSQRIRERVIEQAQVLYESQ